MGNNSGKAPSSFFAGNVSALGSCSWDQGRRGRWLDRAAACLFRKAKKDSITSHSRLHKIVGSKATLKSCEKQFSCNECEQSCCERQRVGKGCRVVFRWEYGAGAVAEDFGGMGGTKVAKGGQVR